MIRVMIRDKNTGIIDCWTFNGWFEAGKAVIERLKQSPGKDSGEWSDIHVMEAQTDKET